MLAPHSSGGLSKSTFGLLSFRNNQDGFLLHFTAESWRYPDDYFWGKTLFFL